ncbi:MAG: excalibur calcium-binding domain-containing protein [Nocardioides sp.]|uniref:excalibur calcium-binding domain-containing protein n=1 Tax=Nocardioides sp. TaxID=35761 RepID=UPI0039E40AAC
MTSPRTLAAASLTALALTLPLGLASPAEAAPGKYYSSCDKLHKDYRHGVARSKAAANRAVRDGYGRPSTSRAAKKVYARNHSRLDRDNDGTACEA